MRLRTPLNPLENQIGLGVLLIAVGINLALFLAALVALIVSQSNQGRVVSIAKNLQLEEMNKNSLTVFNKLLKDGIIAKNVAGRWEPSGGTSNTLWSSLRNDGSTTNLGQIKVNLCPPNFNTNANTHGLSNCNPQSSIVTVSQELPDGRLKLNLSAENGKHRASLTVVTQVLPQSCVESTDNSKQTFSSVWGLGQGKGTLIYQANQVIRTQSLPYPEFSMALNYNNPWMMLRSRNGVEDLATLKQTCNVFGYRDYISSTCNSGHTGCNFSSPSDNTLLQYNATTQKWGAVSAGTRFNTTYLYTITCQGRKLCYDDPKPSTGQWYQATGQNCSTFCSDKGLVNAQSPDSWTITASTGKPFLMSGSACTSGEVIPPSAATAKLAGKLSYPAGCWTNCNTGATIFSGKSFGSRCYGNTGWDATGAPQGQDNDPTDTTVGCYCQ